MQDYLAVAALAISILVAFIQWKQNKKINTMNIESTFYNEIFMNCLIVDIPIARNQVRFQKNKLSKEYKQLTKAILKLKKNMLYFKFRDRDFYDNLENQLVSLDEYLVNLSSKDIQKEEQPECLRKTDKKIHEIYDCIFTNYLGK